MGIFHNYQQRFICCLSTDCGLHLEDRKVKCNTHKIFSVDALILFYFFTDVKMMHYVKVDVFQFCFCFSVCTAGVVIKIRNQVMSRWCHMIPLFIMCKKSLIPFFHCCTTMCR